MSISPVSALVEKSWNENTKTLSVVLSYMLGALEVTVLLTDPDSDGDAVIDS
ncbi:MAG: hypothetical protein P8O06_03115 [Porticoccaceae bacterium]|nr:hypothetical protein [Porticoccaceae bacterium]